MKYLLFFIIFISLILICYNNKYNNKYNKKKGGLFISRQDSYDICNKDTNTYFKNACTLKGYIDYENDDNTIDYLKNHYLLHDNIYDNIVDIYYKVYLPFIVILNIKTNKENKEVVFLNKYLLQINKLLFQINKEFYIIDYFNLYKLFNSDIDTWIKKWLYYRRKYQLHKKMYSNNISIFFLLSIDPLKTKLYSLLHKKLYNNTEWNNLKNTHSNIIEAFIPELLYIDIYNSQRHQLNNTFNESSSIIKIEQIIKIILKSYKNHIHDFINDLYLLDNTINKVIYTKFIKKVTTTLIDNIYYWNNICSNSNLRIYKDNHSISCPAKIEIINNNTSKEHFCFNDNETRYIDYNNNANNDSECQYKIKNCEIQLNNKLANKKETQDNSYNKIKAITTPQYINQNNCNLKFAVKNISKSEASTLLYDRFIVDTTIKPTGHNILCYMSNIESQRYTQTKFNIKNKITYIVKNNVYSYIYIPLIKIQRKYDFKRYVGHLLLRNKSTYYNVKYLYNSVINLKCQNKINQNKDVQENYTDKIKSITKNVLFNPILQIHINIGKGGSGGIYENTQYICAHSGGNTIIRFPVKDRNYNWNNTIISYGGNSNSTLMPDMYNKFGKLIKQQSNNKGTMHPYFIYYNKCGGGGGGCFNQKNNINKLVFSNTKPDMGNKYNNVPLFTLNKKYTIYLAKDSQSSQAYIINKSDSNKKKIPQKVHIYGGQGGEIDVKDNNVNKLLLNGQAGKSIGSGGGGGAKYIDTDTPQNKNISIGNGGNGYKGAIFILDYHGVEIFNSIKNINDTHANKLYTIEDKTDRNEHFDYEKNIIRIKQGTLFYIITIGGGGGGSAGGTGGSGGNIVITQHFYTTNLNSTNIPFKFIPIFNKFKQREKKFLEYYTSIMMINSLNNINNNNNCINCNCTLSKLNNIEDIHDIVEYEGTQYIGLMYNQCLLSHTVNHFNKKYELYSLTDDILKEQIDTYAYTIQLIKYKDKDDKIDMDKSCYAKLVLYNNQDLASYLQEFHDVMFYYIHDLSCTLIYKLNIQNTESNNSYWKQNTFYKNKYFKDDTTNKYYFFYHQENSLFKIKDNQKNVTKNLWVFYNYLQIHSMPNDLDTYDFECISNIHPNLISDSIICKVTLKTSTNKLVNNIDTDFIFCLKYKTKHKSNLHIYTAYLYPYGTSIYTLKSSLLNTYNNIDIFSSDLHDNCLNSSNCSLQNFVTYFNKNNLLEINGIYKCSSSSLSSEKTIDFSYEDSITLYKNTVHILSITDIINSNYVNVAKIKERHIHLMNKYFNSKFVFYYIYNNSSSSVKFEKNKKYKLNNFHTVNKSFDITYIYSIEVYDIILVNKSVQTEFELSNIYQLNIVPSTNNCKNESDIFNKDEKNNKICCNTPILKLEEYKKNCNISVCWHTGTMCKTNYFKIVYVYNKNYYFNTGNIPDFNSDTSVIVDITRNNITMKQDYEIKLYKTSEKSHKDLLEIHKNIKFYILGDPYIIRNTPTKLNLSTINQLLYLYGNDIEIHEYVNDILELNKTLLYTNYITTRNPLNI